LLKPDDDKAGDDCDDRLDPGRQPRVMLDPIKHFSSPARLIRTALYEVQPLLGVPLAIFGAWSGVPAGRPAKRPGIIESCIPTPASKPPVGRQ
jgi:hypothetical protein